MAPCLVEMETPGVEIDRRVTRRYESSDEDTRLWQPGKDDLVRLRTREIFEQFLPRSGPIVDVGGGGPERTPRILPPRATT